MQGWFKVTHPKKSVNVIDHIKRMKRAGPMAQGEREVRGDKGEGEEGNGREGQGS